MLSERRLLWDDVRISNEAEQARDELDGSVYVRHVITQLLVRMRSEYESELNSLAAQERQQDDDWLAILRAIARLDDSEWQDADAPTLLEQFDPWNALRVIEERLTALQRWEPEELAFAAGAATIGQIGDVLFVELYGETLQVDLPKNIRLCRRQGGNL